MKNKTEAYSIISNTQSLPSEEEISQILEYGKRYPSGDNTQPFHLEQISHNQFDIIYHEDLGRHVLNIENFSSIFALGCLIESLNIGASIYSCKIEITFLEDYGSDKKRWLSFKVFKTDVAKDSLAESVKLRHTNRGLFSRQWSDMDQMILKSSIKASLNSSITDFYISRNQPLFTEYILKCEEIFWKQRKIAQDIARWVKLSVLKNPERGFYWKTLGTTYMETLALVFSTKIKYLPPLLEKIMIFLSKSKIKKSIDHSAGIIFFSTTTKDKKSLLEVGRAIFRSWLQLTALDYEVQPLSLSTLLPFSLPLSKEFNPYQEWKEQVFLKQKELYQHLGLKKSQELVWAFRFGKKLSSDSIVLSKREEKDYLIKKSR